MTNLVLHCAMLTSFNLPGLLAEHDWLRDWLPPWADQRQGEGADRLPRLINFVPINLFLYSKKTCMYRRCILVCSFVHVFVSNVRNQIEHTMYFKIKLWTLPNLHLFFPNILTVKYYIIFSRRPRFNKQYNRDKYRVWQP